MNLLAFVAIVLGIVALFTNRILAGVLLIALGILLLGGVVV